MNRRSRNLARLLLEETRPSVRSFVFGEAQRLNLPVVMVTHDAEDANAAMDVTGGEIIDLGTPG